MSFKSIAACNVRKMSQYFAVLYTAIKAVSNVYKSACQMFILCSLWYSYVSTTKFIIGTGNSDTCTIM